MIAWSAPKSSGKWSKLITNFQNLYSYKVTVTSSKKLWQISVVYNDYPVILKRLTYEPSHNILRMARTVPFPSPAPKETL